MEKIGEAAIRRPTDDPVRRTKSDGFPPGLRERMPLASLERSDNGGETGGLRAVDGLSGGYYPAGDGVRGGIPALGLFPIARKAGSSQTFAILPT